ncbi:MAG: phage terminase large subunit family protein [Novosphingobium sp.]|nr:phage terminase large subunit family protein [Novosphingobium sp.]
MLSHCVRYGRRIVAGKGVAGNRPALQMSKSKGTRLFLVGVDGIKASLLQRLSRGRSIRFSNTLTEEWFEQLASERRIIRYLRGRPIRQFVRIAGRRAEALDCVVYATAARELVTANPDRREEELASRATPKRAPSVIRSKWLG